MNNLPPGMFNQFGQPMPIVPNQFHPSQPQYLDQRLLQQQQLRFLPPGANIYGGVPFVLPGMNYLSPGLLSPLHLNQMQYLLPRPSNPSTVDPYHRKASKPNNLLRPLLLSPTALEKSSEIASYPNNCLKADSKLSEVKAKSETFPLPPMEPQKPLPPLPSPLKQASRPSPPKLIDSRQADDEKLLNSEIEEKNLKETSRKTNILNQGLTYEDISSPEPDANDNDTCKFFEVNESIEKKGETPKRPSKRVQELEEINKLIQKSASKNDHYERKRDRQNRSDSDSASPMKREVESKNEGKTNKISESVSRISVGRVARASNSCVEKKTVWAINGSPPKKKKRRKSKDKKKRDNSKDSIVGVTHYWKSEFSEDLVEAKLTLINLHERFEVFCNSKHIDQRSVVNDSVSYNQEKEDIEKCFCTGEKKQKGVHHNKYPRQKLIEPCKTLTNNADRLFHYKMTITPTRNFTTKRPTVVYHDGKEFKFDGFSIFSHSSLDKLPLYTFQRSAYEYTIELDKTTRFPQNFCVKDLDLIQGFWFHDLAELNDWEFDEKWGCPLLHFMPRFVCESNESEGFEYLPMAQLLLYHIESYTPFHDAKDVSIDWEDFEQITRGSIIVNPNKKPRCIRVDDFREGDKKGDSPWFIHTASIPEIAEVSLRDLKSVTEEIGKISKAMRNRAVQDRKEKERLFNLQQKLDEMTDKRNSTKFKDLKISMEGYFNTGLRWDVFQHMSYLHGFWKHYKFISCLNLLEEQIKYTFTDISLLKTAVTLPSYLDQSSMDVCTNISVHNLGRKKPECNPLKVGNTGTRKKGVMSLAHIMATLRDEKLEKKSKCPHNERLEFLGDALLDYLTSLHLFLMFPDKDVGLLTQFRTDIVRTENLGQIGKMVHLEDFLLIGHHSGIQYNDKISEHYQGNTLEAIIGAVYLDGGLNACDKLLCNLLFWDDKELAHVWKSNQQHPLQKENPNGDRHMIPNNKDLQKIVELEKVIGIQFKNIRLLTKAFVRNVAGLQDPKLTGGDYNRLEFLGDAILKYICSDYLYKTFPDHQEGPLTLLRISMINAKTLTSSALDLGLDQYIVFQTAREAQNAKSKVYSDVFESLLGAIHIDRNQKGIQYCRKIIEISILSRLDSLIMNQDWIDPKTQLQQCCLSLREDGSPDEHPVYKKDQDSSENNKFKVIVYFRGRKLGTGVARTVKEAEKEAARDALANNHFEQHARQKRLIYKKFGPARDSVRRRSQLDGEGGFDNSCSSKYTYFFCKKPV